MPLKRYINIKVKKNKASKLNQQQTLYSIYVFLHIPTACSSTQSKYELGAPHTMPAHNALESHVDSTTSCSFVKSHRIASRMLALALQITQNPRVFSLF